jgi:hypothetical protein
MSEEPQMKIVYLLALIGITLLSACDGQAPEQARPEIKAEALAVTKKGSFMCLTSEGANTFFEHAVRGEKTKMEQILSTGACSLVREGMKVKVLAVRGNVSEVVRVDVSSAMPLWAATEFLQPAIPN